MLFSRQHLDDFWYALLGCLVVAVVLGLLVTFCGSFSVGWFTPAAGTLLLQTVVGVFALCFTLAVIGLTDAMVFVGLLPLLIVAMALEGEGAME